MAQTKKPDFKNALVTEEGRPLTMEEILQAIVNLAQDAIRVDATISPPVASPTTKAAFVRGLKAPAAIATPEALAVAGTYVTTVTIWGMRAARVMNSDVVYIDSVAGNDQQLTPILPGTFVTITAPPGKVIDLGDIYVDSLTLTDGVFFFGML